MQAITTYDVEDIEFSLVPSPSLSEPDLTILKVRTSEGEELALLVSVDQLVRLNGEIARELSRRSDPNGLQ